MRKLLSALALPLVLSLTLSSGDIPPPMPVQQPAARRIKKGKKPRKTVLGPPRNITYGGRTTPLAGTGYHSDAARAARRAAHKESVAAVKAKQRDYDAWMLTLSAQDLAFARAHKLDRPMPEGGFSRPGEPTDALEHAEHEPIPPGELRGTRNGAPLLALRHETLDRLEPAVSSTPIEGLSPAEITGARDVFGDVLQWAFQPTTDPGHPVIHLGRRCAVIIAAMAPDQADGLPINPALARHLLSYFGDDYSATLHTLQTAGAPYRRVLEWLGRGADLAALGTNLRILAYHIRPDLIDAATMKDLGAAQGNTRQAINRFVQSMRDTFQDFIRAAVARPMETRLRCQLAQTA